MVLQVYGELLFNYPLAEVRPLFTLFRDTMQHAYLLDVPLRVEVKSCHNWSEVTPIDHDDAENVLEFL